MLVDALRVSCLILLRCSESRAVGGVIFGSDGEDDGTDDDRETDSEVEEGDDAEQDGARLPSEGSLRGLVAGEGGSGTGGTRSRSYSRSSRADDEIRHHRRGRSGAGDEYYNNEVEGNGRDNGSVSDPDNSGSGEDSNGSAVSEPESRGGLQLHSSQSGTANTIDSSSRGGSTLIRGDSHRGRGRSGTGDGRGEGGMFDNGDDDDRDEDGTWEYGSEESSDEGGDDPDQNGGKSKSVGGRGVRDRTKNLRLEVRTSPGAWE